MFGCAPRKSESETFPALEIPGIENLFAIVGEEEDVERADCQNGTAEEREEKERTKSRAKKRIENCLETV